MTIGGQSDAQSELPRRGTTKQKRQDDIIEKEGTTWIGKATDRRRRKTLMEGYIL